MSFISVSDAIILTELLVVMNIHACRLTGLTVFREKNVRAYWREGNLSVLGLNICYTMPEHSVI